MEFAENLLVYGMVILTSILLRDITSCIHNLTFVPEKSVDLPGVLCSGKNNGRKRLSAGDSASVIQPRKKQIN